MPDNGQVNSNRSSPYKSSGNDRRRSKRERERGREVSAVDKKRNIAGAKAITMERRLAEENSATLGEANSITNQSIP